MKAAVRTTNEDSVWKCIEGSHWTTLCADVCRQHGRKLAHVVGITRHGESVCHYIVQATGREDREYNDLNEAVKRYAALGERADV